MSASLTSKTELQVGGGSANSGPSAPIPISAVHDSEKELTLALAATGLDEQDITSATQPRQLPAALLLQKPQQQQPASAAPPSTLAVPNVSSYLSPSDREAKYRVMQAFRQLAAHFETAWKPRDEDDAEPRLPERFAQHITSLMVQPTDEFAMAHQMLCQVTERCHDSALDRQHLHALTEVLRLLTMPRCDGMLYQSLREHDALQAAGFSREQEAAPAAPRPLTVQTAMVAPSSVLPNATSNAHADHMDSPPTTTTQLKAWKRHPSSASPVSANGPRPELLHNTPLDGHATASTVNSLWLARNVGMQGSGSALLGSSESTGISADSLLVWKLFWRMHSVGTRLPQELYVSLAQRIGEHQETDKAIEVMNASPTTQWNLATYRLLIFLHLSKKPKDAEAAQKILTQYAKTPIMTITKQADGTLAVVNQLPTEAETHVLWFYYTSLVKGAKWTDCAERYAEAKTNADEHNQANLDDAIMAVALTYRQYEYGWQVYEKMKDLDRHSPAIAMSLCWKAFFATDPDTQQRVHSREELLTWEARAWAVYGRLQQSSEVIKKSCMRYVTSRLREIVEVSPEIDSRPAKLQQIHE